MKRFIGILILIGMMVVIFSPTPTQANPPQQDGVFVTLEPNFEVQQGRTTLIRVQGFNLVEVRATFQNQLIELYPTNVGDWVGFLAADFEGQAGAFILDVFARAEGQQAPTHHSQTINVLSGAFDYQEIEIPFNLSPLLDPTLNEEDFNTLVNVHNRVTPERLFTTFVQPIPGPAISFFGGWRNYNNGSLRGRHTGSDYRAITGTPVGAASEGRVVFAKTLPIHGTHIVIDHGWGVLSGYSHLSEVLVVPGQLVRQGETIGLVGTTGRTQGPHLHFEMAVNGKWVDPIQFLDLTIPLPAPN